MARSVDHDRQCALTRTVQPVSGMVRFVPDPDGKLVPDVDGRAPGRGVWVTARADHVREAAARNVFARSLKRKIHLPPDLAQLTQTRLEQRLQGALGLARKAGQLQTGATRVKSAIAAGNVLALLTARDAAPDGRRKMMASLRAADLEQQVPHFDILSSSQLGLALGQENVIHAALTSGAAAESALVRVRKLARYVEPVEREKNETKIR